MILIPTYWLIFLLLLFLTAMCLKQGKTQRILVASLQVDRRLKNNTWLSFSTFKDQSHMLVKNAEKYYGFHSEKETLLTVLHKGHKSQLTTVHLYFQREEWFPALA